MSDEYRVETIGQTLTTDPIVSRAVTPRGPKGLWDALVAATGQVQGRCETSDHDGGEFGTAHLAYLARVAGDAPYPHHSANRHGGAEVVDMAAYRSQRHCRAS